MGIHTPCAMASTIPNRFGRVGIDWSAWLPLVGEAIDHVDGVLLRQPEIAGLRSVLEDAILRPTDPALRPGERALVRTAVARRNGCLYTAAGAAHAAAHRLNRPRDVDLLLSEGLDAPLTGRAGALVLAAGELANVPPSLTPDCLDGIARLGLAEDEVMEMILSAAFAS